MITEKTYTGEWLTGIRQTLGYKKRRPDPALVEKATKALHLLEELCKSDLDFIFKGGTALLLLLDEMHRLSIDIDIIVKNDDQYLLMDKILAKIITDSPIFIRCEENVRYGNHQILKAHYKFYYNSTLDGNEKYVLLDIVYEDNHYPEIVSTDIDCTLIDCFEPSVYSATPSIDCILGDKMTAFAPNTTGIPYGKGKELEIIKQLFDVANLFDSMNDIGIVKTTFNRIATQELIYRRLANNMTHADVLEDIFNTCFIISLRGKIEPDSFQLLMSGIKSLKNFVITSNFTLDSAINYAAKAAYLAMLIKYDITNFKRYMQGIDLNNLRIENPKYLKLNSIKKTDPEAFFYWYKCIELLN